MKARRRVVHAIKDARHFFILLLRFRLQVIQDGLLLLPSLFGGGTPEEGALGRVRRRREARRGAAQRAISESDLCSLMLGAAPAPHTESLSALQTSKLSFNVHYVESEWSAPSLS